MTYISVTLRPLPSWPHPPTSPRRHAQFRSPSKFGKAGYTPGQRISYERSLDELRYEVDLLGGTEISIGIGLEATQIRSDGAPRASARPPVHPGVEVSFSSRFGRLTYATDVFLDWRDNVRAIAKALEALRAIERWGVSRRGQQYAGFALLTAGPGLEERGWELVQRFGTTSKALRATHPDTREQDMTDRDFQAVNAYRKAHPED